MTLVNINQSHEREVIVQAGGYGEHQCASVALEGHGVPIGAAFFTVRLAPGAGGRLVIRMDRYTNQPTLRHPWDPHRR